MPRTVRRANGYGPVLPATGGELLEQADTVHQVAVDARTGAVIAVSDPVRIERDCPLSPELDALLRGKPVLRDLTSDAYRPGTRLRRLVQARDVRCVFPGCRKPAQQTDLDHRIPWPTRQTSTQNLQCLCRRHHRAKQAAFTVSKDDDGVIRWTTRGGWAFPRRPQGY